MKRIIAIALAVLMIAAFLCACGGKKKTNTGANNGNSTTATQRDVKTTVDKKYDEGFAEKYAKSVTSDDSGNKTYEFDGSSYDTYRHDYNNQISSQVSSELAQEHDRSYGQFCYINNEKQAFVVGLNPGQYDEAVAAEEAKKLADKAFPYFMGLEEPVKTIKVIYCNANNQEEVYGTFEFTAE